MTMTATKNRLRVAFERAIPAVGKMWQEQEVVCFRGHTLDGIRPTGRYCKTCERERKRRERANR